MSTIDAKFMHWSIPEGGYVRLEWPDHITLESLEMAEEVLRLQLNSVRKTTQRRKAAEATASPQAIAQDSGLASKEQ